MSATGAPEPRLPIQERFVSIQGEGMLVGTPSSFIRVSGCNLRCAWCDSPHASWTPRSRLEDIDRLLAFCYQGPQHVVLTGGEPLLHPGIGLLSRELRRLGHVVTVETAGTVWLDGLECDFLSLSPKLSHSTPWTRDPSWAVQHEQRRLNPKVLRRLISSFPWQLKVIVRASDPELLERDLEELEHLLDVLGVESSQRERVLLTPEGTDPPGVLQATRTLVDVCIQHQFRLGQRLHLMLFGHRPGT